MPDSSAPVLVTGGSGFLAVHIILRLLGDGRRVRATMRSLDRAPEIRATLEQAGADVSELAFVAADLTADDGWREAVADWQFYMAYSLFRFAAICQGIAKRAIDGTAELAGLNLRYQDRFLKQLSG